MAPLAPAEGSGGTRLHDNITINGRQEMKGRLKGGHEHEREGRLNGRHTASEEAQASSKDEQEAQTEGIMHYNKGTNGRHNAL